MAVGDVGVSWLRDAIGVGGGIFLLSGIVARAFGKLTFSPK